MLLNSRDVKKGKIMSSERKKTCLNHRLCNWGALALLMLFIVQGIPFVGKTEVFNGANPIFVTDLGELYPEEYQYPPEFRPPEITDEDFASAEIAISIA
jgi:hypothetical protein